MSFIPPSEKMPNLAYSTLHKMNTFPKIIQPKSATSTKTAKNYTRKTDVTYGKLKSLVENGGSKVEIDKVVAQLMNEGWMSYKNLPKGWLRSTQHHRSSTAIQYMVYDPFCAKFGSKHAAVGSLKRMGLGKQYIAKFIVGDSDIAHFVGTAADDDWVSGDKTVPEG